MVKQANPLSAPAARLADWAASLQWADVPESGRLDARLRVLDSIGLMLVGKTTEAGAAVLRTWSSPQPCAATRALVHGILAHCRDFDDTFADSVVHPGSVVIPAALALAEACQSTAEDFGAAIVAGYEVAARVGQVFGRALGARGFHATGVVGPVAAAVAAGRILRLSPAQLTHAIGLACSMSSGLTAFMSDGAWSKWLHAGWAAHGGISAAELARQGFRGPGAVMTGPGNLFNAFIGDVAVDMTPIDQIGEAWLGRMADFKYYPCAHVSQPFIDAALAVMRENGLAAADVEGVLCGIAPWAAAVVAEPREAKLRFGSELEAIGSLPYQIAVAILDGEVSLRALTHESRQRRDVAHMAGKVTHRSDAELGQGFDGYLVLTTRAGRTFTVQARAAAPDAARIAAKFRTNTALYIESLVDGGDASSELDTAQFKRRAQTFPDIWLASLDIEWRKASALLMVPAR